MPIPGPHRTRTLGPVWAVELTTRLQSRCQLWRISAQKVDGLVLRTGSACVTHRHCTEELVRRSASHCEVSNRYEHWTAVTLFRCLCYSAKDLPFHSSVWWTKMCSNMSQSVNLDIKLMIIVLIVLINTGLQPLHAKQGELLTTHVDSFCLLLDNFVKRCAFDSSALIN